MTTPPRPEARESGRRPHRLGGWTERLRSVGHEPDPRFTLANERTFLAWIRTSLALVAGGVALQAFSSELDAPWLARLTGIVLVTLAGVISAGAFARWLRAERALRCDEPLPVARMTPMLGFSVAVVAVVALGFVLVA